jgi:adenylosuccinate synthase
MAEAGQEYGTVTGRPRRCGWLDLLLLRYAARLSGFTEIALTKTDVLDDFDEIKVCTGYRQGSEILDWPDLDPGALEQCEPVYETLQGWNCDTSEIRSANDLPDHLREYIGFVQDYTGVRISVVSVGPSSDAIVQLD